MPTNEELLVTCEQAAAAGARELLAWRGRFSTREKSGKEYINEIKAGKILNSIFPDQPNHPGIAHYIIHNYDNPDLAQLALPTARRYADIAPGSAHAS